jgi:hypothetical protein
MALSPRFRAPRFPRQRSALRPIARQSGAPRRAIERGPRAVRPFRCRLRCAHSPVDRASVARTRGSPPPPAVRPRHRAGDRRRRALSALPCAAGRAAFPRAPLCFLGFAGLQGPAEVANWPFVVAGACSGSAFSSGNSGFWSPARGQRGSGRSASGASRACSSCPWGLPSHVGDNRAA